jgi:MarR family 2-MHQ and catechol resistance regulon transcriptional repressor
MAKPRDLMLYVPKENHDILLAAFGNDFEESTGRALYAMRACARLFAMRSSEWLAPAGIDPTTMTILVWLYAANGGKGVPVSEIGRYIHSSGANLTAKLSSVEADGLITRTVNLSDRRSFTVKLTPAGRDALQRVFPTHARNLKLAFGTLTAGERETLVELLVKVGARLQSLDGFEIVSKRSRRGESKKKRTSIAS